MIFKTMVLHGYWTDLNNFRCFIKLRPVIRRYVNLEGLSVRFDPPLDTIMFITNTQSTQYSYMRASDL